MGFAETFADPPREYSLVPFWFWNDDLSEAELKRQIDDFEAHGVHGFVPHPRIGLPESIGFMSERFLHFLRVAVDYAAEKGMMVYLYDEGMYPSGSCAGQVVAADPRHAARCLQRRAKGAALGEDEELVAGDAAWDYVHTRSMGIIRGVHYLPDGGEFSPPAGDILNPEATASFIRLVHDRYFDTLQDHFGKTVRGVFTDEPSPLGRGGREDVRPWTRGFADFLQARLGYDFRPHLAALWDETLPDADLHRRDFYGSVAARLHETFYAPCSRWCEAHGVALTGHPAGGDDIGAERFFHIPGQDVVWRYLEPDTPKALEGEQSTMGKCSSSAQRHLRRARNANECLGAYGWELTYAEMRWVTDWLLVRGVNLLMPHAFYYSVRGPRRDERPPDVGPNNTWWPEYKRYADYCRRLCWMLAHGRHVCDLAVLGSPDSLPWRAAKTLFQAQRDFNYLDSDTLLHDARVDGDAIRIADMAYRALVVDGPAYATPDVLGKLRPFVDAGRAVAFLEPVPEIPQLATGPADLLARLEALAPADVVLDPPNPDLRYVRMRHEGTDVYLFFNEGKGSVDSAIRVAAGGKRRWWDPDTLAQSESPADRLSLPPYATRVLQCAG